MTLRRLILLLLGLAIALAAVNITVSRALESQLDRVAAAEEHLYEAAEVASQLRRSSDDLTRFARLFVQTGDSSYLGYFRQVLAIRDGELPRPPDYGGIFWDRVVAGRAQPPGPSGGGEPRSLDEVIEDLGLRPGERALLDEALRRSDDLAALEEEAFALLEGDGTSVDSARARDLLVGAAYLEAKAGIMEPVAEFGERMEGRTRDTLTELQAGAERLVLLELLSAVGLLGLLLIAGYLVHRRVLVRVGALAGAAEAIRKGDLDARSDVRGGDELGRLGQTFDRMVGRLGRTLEDVEAQKRRVEIRNRRLRDLNEVKDKFIGMAAHDLRNPLASIRGFSEVMLQSPDRDPTEQEFLQLIHDNSAHMLHLVNELLDVSAIESGHIELNPVEVSVTALLRQRVAVLHPIAEQKDSRIETDFADGGTCRADPGRVVQIIDNLVSNALKFSPPGSTVTVRQSTRDGRVRFAVADEGPGLTEEDRERMFKDFQKLSARPTGNESSTGLGLSIVKRIVDAHAGEITVRSTWGQGAEFIVELPPGTAPADDESASEAGPSRAAS